MSKIDNQDVAIRVHNIKKDFYLPHEKSSKSLKSIIVNTFKKKNKGADTQHVLRGLSFDIKKGEFFGIVGRNGSGKSTLLKILAQIYQPTSGKVEHFGKLVPFIELGVGFNPELSGRENVYLNGALLGFTREEIAEKYDKIVEFAELEDFMDQKLKNYSSGMQVRLAFSVAIQADADILLIDEVLAVGDEAFQRKCYAYFAELRRRRKTVVLVTHSMDSVHQFCTKAMLIDGGKIVRFGDTSKVAQKYLELNDTDNATVNVDDSKKQDTDESDKKQDAQTQYIQASMSIEKINGKVALELQIQQKVKLKDPVVVVNIFRDTGEQAYRWASDEKLPNKELDLTKNTTIKIIIDDIFPVGVFSAGVRVVPRDRSKNYAIINDIAGFKVKKNTRYNWDLYWHPHEDFDVVQDN